MIQVQLSIKYDLNIINVITSKNRSIYSVDNLNSLENSLESLNRIGTLEPRSECPKEAVAPPNTAT